MNDVLFITFDQKKDEYPAMPYSVAVLVAALKKANQKTAHYSIDLQHALEEKNDKETLTTKTAEYLKDNLNYFKKFRFIAISLTSWSIEHCQSLLELLIDYMGRIILGGYEVTAMSDEMLRNKFPRADYFIKGYAEKALVNLVAKNYLPSNHVIQEKIESSDLASPYLMGVINIFSRKIHWETKRGCPYRCGFCEWGNATKNIIEIDKERLFFEIETFRDTCIDEINILDGTFNFGKNYIEIFKELLTLKLVKITCQARFENLLLKDGEEFLNLCRQNRHKIHLEFGLQTIHKNEMITIGRDNDINWIEQALEKLNEYKIDYEVSIIYAIPGQTVESFIDTIEFLLKKGCNKIKAYPLRIPKNSEMDRHKIEMCVTEGKNKYNVTSVLSSFSFPVEQRVDMEIIAERLNKGALFNYKKPMSGYFVPLDFIKYKEVTPYQWDIISIDENAEIDPVIELILNHYLENVLTFLKTDITQYMLAMGDIESRRLFDKNKLYRDLISGELCFDLLKVNQFEIFTSKEIIEARPLKYNGPEFKPRKYRCRLRISKTGNVYVFTEIIWL